MKKSKKMRLHGEILVLLLSVCLLFFAPSYAFAQSSLIKKGKEIFESKCTICHTIGGGKKVGPDLQSVIKRRQKNWLIAFISNPDRVFAANDPTAAGLLNEYKIKMPNLGLTPDAVDAVIAFLETQEGQAQVTPKTKPTGNVTPPAPAVPPAPSAATKRPTLPAVGSAETGKALFIGKTEFKNNGPPCKACHSVPGIKYFGGGSLGPDLTTVYSSLGDGIVSVLVNVPFPTMKPIFDNHPLTTEEARDLAAFLQGTTSERPENYTARVIAVSLIAFIILLILVHFLWRNRLVSVRKAMVERAEQEGENR